MKLIEAADGLRSPERFANLLKASKADSRGRAGEKGRQPFPQADYLAAALDAVAGVPNAPLRARGLEGLELAAALREARISAIAETKAGWQPASPA